MCLFERDNPNHEPARRPAHQAKLTHFGGALEIAQGTLGAAIVATLAAIRERWA